MSDPGTQPLCSVRVEVPDASLLNALLGQHDEHLKIVEEGTGVQAVVAVVFVFENEIPINFFGTQE